MAERIYLDPDFRPTPKTEHFCCVCQRDLAPGEKRIWIDGSCMFAVHPDDLDEDCQLASIGPECSRDIPVGYLIDGDQASPSSEKSDD